MSLNQIKPLTDEQRLECAEAARAVVARIETVSILLAIFGALGRWWGRWGARPGGPLGRAGGPLVGLGRWAWWAAWAALKLS